MDFQIGDRVLYAPHKEEELFSERRKAMAGQEATVICFHRSSTSIGIRFDAPIGIHGCDGACEFPYGKWASEEDLVLISGDPGISVDVEAFL